MTSSKLQIETLSILRAAVITSCVVLTVPAIAHATTASIPGASTSTGGYRGANAWDVYGGNSAAGMSAWGINIIREDIPNFDVVPMGTNTVQADGSYLHGLRSIVNQNSAAGDTTILCPFTWAGSQILGVTPSQTSYWNSYNSQLGAMARQFAGQSNVWLEVWNEPYAWNTPTASSQWLSDMQTMVNSIRNGTGFTGKIVIPGGQEAGSVTPVVNEGSALVQYDPQHNLMFDLHAYNSWFSTGTAGMESSFASVQNTGVKMIVGEYGWSTSAGGYNVSPFLQATTAKNVGAIAWNWSDADSDTLHNSDGTLNDSPQNYNWASQVLNYTLGTGRAALPGAWSDATIGSPTIPGAGSYSKGVYTLFGSGSDIWNSSDQFNFASRPLTGNGAITAQVASQQNTDPWAKAGVMFRDSAAADAQFVAMELTPGNGVQMQARTTAGANAIEIGSVAVSGTIWMRLVKTGSTFTGYYSTAAPQGGALDWIEIGSVAALNFTDSSFLAGLAVSSHDTSSISTASFVDVTVTPEPATIALLSVGMLGVWQLRRRIRGIQ